MSEVFRCDDKETLVAYLYGEVDGDMRREVERHLRTCAACTHETEGLQSVRQDLQSWLPPEPDLAFSIVQRSAAPATVLRPSRWSSLRAVPGWAGVAAAALFIGVAASLANIQVRSTSDGFFVTTGWMQPPDVAQRAASAPDAAPNDEWRRELAALEQSLRSEIVAQQAVSTVSSAAAPVRVAAAGLDMSANVETLRRVRQMIAESEERLRQEHAKTLLHADAMWNLRRQTDLARINGSFQTLQNRTIAVQSNQQEMAKEVNNIRRANFTQPNQ